MPPYSHQADVWVDLLKMLGYTQVVFMHSSDADGRSVSSRFLDQALTMDSADTDMKVSWTRPGRDDWGTGAEGVWRSDAAVA